MPKPLKSKHLNKHKRLRDQVLSRQGVGDGKRKRLGHSSHFGKIEVIPIVRKSKDAGGAEVNVPGQKKQKSKFNKFKGEGDAGAEGECTPQPRGQEQESAERAKKEGIEGRLPGESFTKFMKRLNTETQQMLVTQATKATHVVEKRKNFLNQRKKERKEKMQNKKKGLHKIREDSEDDEVRV